MKSQGSLISELSAKSKKKVISNDSNNPLVRQNTQLKEELNLLQEKFDKSESEVLLLKQSLSDVSKAKNDEVDSTSSKLDDIKQKLSATTIENKLLKKKLSNYKASASNLKKINNPDVFGEMSVSEFMDLNLSSNAQKFYRAIIKYCLTGDFYILSGRRIKREFSVHDSYFSDARLELKEKGLIDFKFSLEGRKSVTEYKRLR